MESILEGNDAQRAVAPKLGVTEDVDLIMYSTGDTIITEGDASRHACQLVSGTAKVIREGDVIATIHAGEYFGTIAALTNSRRAATVVAADLCVVRNISKHKFRLLLQTEPGLINRIC